VVGGSPLTTITPPPYPQLFNAAPKGPVDDNDVINGGDGDDDVINGGGGGGGGLTGWARF